MKVRLRHYLTVHLKVSEGQMKKTKTLAFLIILRMNLQNYTTEVAQFKVLILLLEMVSATLKQTMLSAILMVEIVVELVSTKNIAPILLGRT